MNAVEPTDETSAGDLAFRILALPAGQWFALRTGGAAPEDVAEALQIALEAQGADSVQHIEGLPADPAATGIVITTLRDGVAAEEWRALDLARSRWTGGPTVVFVLGPAGWHDLCAEAPDLASWMRQKVWLWKPERDAMDVDSRLGSLRAHFRLTDAAVVTMAVTGKLPAEPAFAEWIALLGRGELLG